MAHAFWVYFFQNIVKYLPQILLINFGTLLRAHYPHYHYSPRIPQIIITRPLSADLSVFADFVQHCTQLAMSNNYCCEVSCAREVNSRNIAHNSCCSQTGCRREVTRVVLKLVARAK